MPIISYNGVRLYDVTVEVTWRSGAFVVRGEIANDATVIAQCWSGENCVVDGRECRAVITLEQERGRVTLHGTSFPWRRKEWEG